MSDFIKELFSLLFSLGLAVIAVLYLLKMKRVSDAIDSVADARVIKVLNLGRGTNGKEQYAITYQVLIDEPFEVLVTPTPVEQIMGDTVAIYYDSHDHSNFYIPIKWKFDDRIKKAIIFVGIAVLCVVGCAIALFT